MKTTAQILAYQITFAINSFEHLTIATLDFFQQERYYECCQLAKNFSSMMIQFGYSK
jgi:hypothetical protein